MLLQEKHHTTDETDIKNLYENPQVWRYRARITVDHLSQMLNSREETCKMLQLFLKEVIMYALFFFSRTIIFTTSPE